MGDDAFADYLAHAIPDFAHDKIQSGQWRRSEALEMSRQQYAELLPQGLATPDNHIFEIHSDTGAVGMLWFAIQPHGDRQIAYVYDVLIHPGHQRQGYGTLAFQALDSLAQRASADAIGTGQLRLGMDRLEVRKL